jgi:hypothetical protein
MIEIAKEIAFDKALIVDMKKNIGINDLVADIDVLH